MTTSPWDRINERRSPERLAGGPISTHSPDNHPLLLSAAAAKKLSLGFCGSANDDVSVRRKKSATNEHEFSQIESASVMLRLSFDSWKFVFIRGLSVPATATRITSPQAGREFFQARLHPDNRPRCKNGRSVPRPGLFPACLPLRHDRAPRQY